MNEKLAKTFTDSSQFQKLANDILQEAKKSGATQAECVIALDKGFSISAHDGEVETVEYNQDKSIAINVLFGKRSGSSSISDMRPDAVKAAVEAACHIAKFTDEDEAAGLPEKEELAFDYPQLDMDHHWPISVEEAIETACQLEREAVNLDKRIMSAEETTVTTMQAFYLYANSQGFMGYYPHSRHEISCVLIAKQHDEMQRNYSYSIAVDPKKLASVSQLAKEAAKRTVDRLGARKIKTMKTPVIYHAEEARGLLGHFIAAISGGNLYRKSSFLLDHLDKKIFPDFMHMQEKPHLPSALGTAPFDEEGVATRENIFIEEGSLRNYCLSVYSARKLNMKTTGNAGGVHNLVVKHSDKNLQALLKTMNTGLLVTEIMGNGVNIVTGDYSRGVGGYWVENGEIQYPVQEITVAGKLQDMYAGIVEIGNDVDQRGNILTGSILINEMMVAGS